MIRQDLNWSLWFSVQSVIELLSPAEEMPTACIPHLECAITCCHHRLDCSWHCCYRRCDRHDEQLDAEEEADLRDCLDEEDDEVLLEPSDDGGDNHVKVPAGMFSPGK